MDSNDLEKERGITILAQELCRRVRSARTSTSSTPRDMRTSAARSSACCPWSMACCCWWTPWKARCRRRIFVTRKALALGLKPIVVVNKIDRPGARPDFVINATFELFDKLGATEEQLDFPVVYASGLSGYAGMTADVARRRHASPVRSHPARTCRSATTIPTARCRCRSSRWTTTAMSARSAWARINRGRIRRGMDVAILASVPTVQAASGRINQVLKFSGLERVKWSSEAEAGDIVLINGIEGIGIGCHGHWTRPRPRKMRCPCCASTSPP